jgi:hypothetical protein
MEKQTSDFKIINIIELFKKKKSIKKKDDVLELLMKLKTSVEFNATIDWAQLYRELGELYSNPLPYYQSDRFTPDPIDSKDMGEVDIFVFGSNTEGIHGAGAAREAVKNYGAIMGQAKGLQGRSYAVVTKDLSKGERSLSYKEIEEQIEELLEFAAHNPQLTFWVTKIGCGLGGYEIGEIAPLFGHKVIPVNVVLPQEFVNPRFYSTCFYSDEEKTYFYAKSDTKMIVVCNDKVKSVYEHDVANYGDGFMPSDVVACSYDDFMTAARYVIGKMF